MPTLHVLPTLRRPRPQCHWRGLPAVTLLCLALAACGGGGGDSPAPTLTLGATGSTTQVSEGGAPVQIQLAGATADSGAITWQLSPAVGSLAGTSASGATYTPPALDTLAGDTTLTITATPGRGQAITLTLQLKALPFTVGSSSPANGGTAQPDAVLSLGFSRVPANASASTVTLRSAAGAVTGTVGAQGKTVQFTPAAPLVWGSRYTLQAQPTLATAAGQALGASTPVVFDTPMPVWDAASTLVATDATASQLRVASDAQGRAVAVWRCVPEGQWTGVCTASRASAAGAWSAPSVLWATPMLDTSGSNINARGVLNLQLAMNAQGTAVAAWNLEWRYLAMNAGRNTRPMAARWQAASQRWTAGLDVPLPATIKEEVDLDPEHAVVVDADGNAQIAWAQNTLIGPYRDDRTDAYTSRWNIGDASPAAAVLLQSRAWSASAPQLVLGPDQAVWAAWGESLFTGLFSFDFAVTVSRRSASTGQWSAATPLAASQGNSQNDVLMYPNLAVDARGGALIVWSGPRPTAAAASEPAEGIWSVRLDPATGRWADAPTVAPLDPTSCNAYWRCTLVGDAGGNATLLLRRGVFSDQPELVSLHFSAETARWQTGSTWPGAAVVMARSDAAGNVLLLWHESTRDTIGPLQVSRWQAGSAVWTNLAAVPDASVRVNDEDAGLTLDARGNALLLWSQPDGQRSVRLAGP